MGKIWRDLGLTYIEYSNIAAKILRQSLKEEFKGDAAKRNIWTVKFTKWLSGKPLRRNY